jgi:hypothetical protein
VRVYEPLHDDECLAEDERNRIYQNADHCMIRFIRLFVSSRPAGSPEILRWMSLAVRCTELKERAVGGGGRGMDLDGSGGKL